SFPKLSRAEGAQELGRRDGTARPFSESCLPAPTWARTTQAAIFCIDGAVPPGGRDANHAPALGPVTLGKLARMASCLPQTFDRTPFTTTEQCATRVAPNLALWQTATQWLLRGCQVCHL